MIRHLSENTTKKAAVPHDYCRNNSFFSFNVFYVRRMILFNFTKSITACFPILQIFFMLMEFTPALTRSECDRKKFDATSLLLINNSQKYIGKIKILRDQMYVPGHRLCFHQTVRSVGICQIYPKTDTDNQFQSFVTKTRDIPSCLSFLQPMTISYFCLRFQNGSNSSGSVWPSESVWKM